MSEAMMQMRAVKHGDVDVPRGLYVRIDGLVNHRGESYPRAVNHLTNEEADRLVARINTNLTASDLRQRAEIAEQVKSSESAPLDRMYSAGYAAACRDIAALIEGSPSNG